MNIPNEIVLGATAIAFAISMAFWLYLLKFKLSQTGKDIGVAVDKKAAGYIKEFKKDFEKGVADLKKEIPTIIATDVPKLLDKEGPKIIKDAMKVVIPELKKVMAEEMPLMMKEQAPKLIETFLEDISDRIADPKEEQTKILMSTMAFQGMAAFRACMQDADFKREVDDFINGKMNKVANQLETRLPNILIKAAPEIKKAFLTGGVGEKGGGGGILGMLGINIEELGGGLGL